MKTCIIGHITHDLYGSELLAGGCAFYGGWTHRRLGASLHLVGGVGTDFKCENELQGLESSLQRRGQTTTFTNFYPDVGPRVQRVGALAPKLDPELPQGEFDVIHLAPVLDEVDFERWVQLARPKAKLLGLNVQGWIKSASPDGRVEQRRWEPNPELLKYVDVACVSDEDLVGQDGLIELLLSCVRIVAWTHGGDGAELFETSPDGSQSKHRLGVYRTECLDPTGAGDVFAAGFMYGLGGGMRPAEAGQLAAAAASIVIEGRGGTTLARISDAFDRSNRVPWEKV